MFDSKSEKMCFVGYAPNGYRMLDDKTNMVYIWHYVLFNENQFKMNGTSKGLCDPGMVQNPETVGAPQVPQVQNELPNELEQQLPELLVQEVPALAQQQPQPWRIAAPAPQPQQQL